MGISRIKSLEKAIDIINLFSERQPTLSLPQISTDLNIPESTTYRLLRTLQQKQVVARDSLSKKYMLDASLLRLATVIWSHLNIDRLAIPHLEKLATRSGETAHLYLLQGHQMVLVEAANSPNTVRFAMEMGTAMPLHAPAGGRAMLAYLPNEFLDECLHLHGLQRFTPYTITDPQKIRRLLSQVRRRGYAIASQQYIQASTAVAAPVFNHKQDVIATIAVAGPMPRFTEKEALALAPHVRKQAAELSAELGASDTAQCKSPQYVEMHAAPGTRGFSISRVRPKRT